MAFVIALAKAFVLSRRARFLSSSVFITAAKAIAPKLPASESA